MSKPFLSVTIACVIVLAVPVLGQVPSIGPCTFGEIEEVPTKRAVGDAVALDATVDSQTDSAGQAAPPAVGDGWIAQRIAEGVGSASSTYTVTRSGSTTVAILTQRVVCEDENETVSASASGYLEIRVIDLPEGKSLGQLSVRKYVTLIPALGVAGTVTVDGKGLSLSESQSYVETDVYEDLDEGDWLPETISFDAELELVGKGEILLHMALVIDDPDCEPVEDWDPDDDPLDPDPPPCLGTWDVGDALHIRTTTGRVWTRVPVLRTFADGAVELDFVLRYDETRGEGPARLGLGWTHSYNILPGAVNIGQFYPAA
jgi:hypothetical protein